jgi:Fic family protein
MAIAAILVTAAEARHPRLYATEVAAQVVVPWQEVTPLPTNIDGALVPLLDTVDALRGAWKESLEQSTPEEFAEARLRSLRRHAIETGIIERLYDVDWGVTEALVAEGLTLEVAEREGGIDDDALAAIRSQFDALQFLADAARDGRELNVAFIRQLHAAISRHQQTYEAVSATGQLLTLPLHHGEWKLQPNHVTRGDGSLLQYTPPEQVAPQMERLMEMFTGTGGAHALIRSAWLHHRFILVHPFEDGNGRVGRALVLLALLRADYAPLVVDRTRRNDYLEALDRANDGDLAPLVRLFAELEIIALRSELERPARAQLLEGTAVDVAKAVADRVSSLRYTADSVRAEKVSALAAALHGRMREHLQHVADGLATTFNTIDLDARATIDAASPPDARARYWPYQLIRTARALDFWTNISEGTWWIRLRLVVLGQGLRYVVAIQKVGRGETGVLAVTAFAELVPPHGDDTEERSFPTPVLHPKSGDSVTLVQSETAESRWPDVQAFVDRTLAAAVAEFGRSLG